MNLFSSIGFSSPGSASPGTVPTDLANLQLWLDASDLSTITESAGSVSAWNDKSGNANHATQGTGANQPQTGVDSQNGLNALTFDGTNHYLQTPFISFTANQTSIYAIAKGVTAAGFKYIVGLSGNDFYLAFGQKDGYWSSVFGNGVSWSQVANIPLILTRDNYQAVGTIQNGTNNPVVNNVDQNQKFEAMAAVSSVLNIGASSAQSLFWDGQIGEILIYDSAHTDGEKSSIMAYLMNKWGI